MLLTFPDPQDHIDWVREGSALVGDGNPYGDPERPGGQHIAGETAGRLMPPFGESLSEEEIVAVVRYEREILSGELEPVLAEGGEGEGSTPAAEAQSEGGNTGGGE